MIYAASKPPLLRRIPWVNCAFPTPTRRTVADGQRASQFATEHCIRYRLQIDVIGRSVSLPWITNRLYTRHHYTIQYSAGSSLYVR